MRFERGRLEDGHRVIVAAEVAYCRGIRGGDGQRTLAAEAMSLASWVGGSDADPEAIARIDAKKERASFEHDLGLSPEAWLKRWRGGTYPSTAESFRTAYRAMLLEGT